jgi:hypothetical protein
MCLQAPSGRVASGEKIGVISFGSQQQQQYRSVYINIAMLYLIFAHCFSNATPQTKAKFMVYVYVCVSFNLRTFWTGWLIQEDKMTLYVAYIANTDVWYITAGIFVSVMGLLQAVVYFIPGNSAGSRIHQYVQSSSASASLLSNMNQGHCPWRWSVWCMKLTAHHCLLPRLKTCGAISPLPYIFMACA